MKTKQVGRGRPVVFGKGVSYKLARMVGKFGLTKTLALANEQGTKVSMSTLVKIRQKYGDSLKIKLYRGRPAKEAA